MAVYVDSMNAAFGRMKMCHMIADTSAELLAMADAIGVDRKWIQYEGERREHFDICKSKRAKAVSLGAIEVSIMQLARILRAKQQPTPPPTRAGA